MAKFEVNWLEDRSDEAVLAEIRRVAALEPHRRLTQRGFDSHSRIKSNAVRQRFGSWAEATRRAGLADALPVYSDASIIEDLKRVSESSKDDQFTIAFYSGHGQYSPSYIKRRFGGWREALDAAGIGSRFVGPPTTERMKSQPGRAMSDEEILAGIREAYAQRGKAPIAGADIEGNSEITQNLMYRRFGSVSAALRLAGVEQVNYGRRYTEDEVFENLLKVWTHYGRPPTVSEMDLPPSTVGKNTYFHRYGGWRKALKAFIKRANSEADVVPTLDPHRADPTETPVPAAVSKTRSQPVCRTSARPRAVRLAEANVRAEDRRKPGDYLQFKVFRRDRFRCRFCGRSPATHLNCILHADHIVPFSKGGRTTFENLQTLCSHCNFGKGNHSV